MITDAELIALRLSAERAEARREQIATAARLARQLAAVSDRQRASLRFAANLPN